MHTNPAHSIQLVEVLRYTGMALLAILLFNVIILVHELGHFFAAKWRGIYVDRIAVWFGKPIWQKTIRGVTLQLGFIPLGGFVSVPQMAIGQTLEGKVVKTGKQLDPITPLDKMIIALGGPVASVLLAVFFAIFVWRAGHPVGESEVTSSVGYVYPTSSAEKAGVKVGDRILKVDGREVTSFTGLSNSVTWHVAKGGGSSVTLDMDRDGQPVSAVVGVTTEPKDTFERAAVRSVDIEPVMRPKIVNILPGSPAATGGLLAGDIILSVNGTQVLHPEAVSDFIHASKGDPLAVNVLRNEKKVELTITPRAMVAPDGSHIIGVGINGWTDGAIAIEHPLPSDQMEESGRIVFETIGSLFNRKSNIRLSQMSGPVGVVHVYTRLLDADEGLMLVLWFSVILNVNLAIVNMLPLPVLDGGYVLMAAIEMIFRRPLPDQFVKIAQNAFAAIILSYLVFITFFDVKDVLN